MLIRSAKLGVNLATLSAEMELAFVRDVGKWAAQSLAADAAGAGGDRALRAAAESFVNAFSPRLTQALETFAEDDALSLASAAETLALGAGAVSSAATAAQNDERNGCGAVGDHQANGGGGGDDGRDDVLQSGRSSSSACVLSTSVSPAGEEDAVACASVDVHAL